MAEPRYYDIRQVRGSVTQIDIDNGIVERGDSSFFDETILRALGDRGWGIFCADAFDPDSAGARRDALEKAFSLAGYTGEHLELAPAEHGMLDVPAMKEDPGDVHLDEKISLLASLEKAARIDGIVNTRASYIERTEHVRIISSEGLDSEYRMTRCGFTISAVARRNGLIQMGRESRHSILGFNLRHQEELGLKAAERAVALLDAREAKGGRTRVILDPELAGVFAHEAVGHASEGDLVKEGNSVLAGRIGERIGVKELTIVDDPSQKEFGFEPMDAEGSRVKRTEIISRGRVNAYLHSRETAAAVGGGDIGHARGMPGEPPLVRMSNTFVEKGDSNLDEILEACGEGILLKGSRGGQVDPGRGFFQFNAEYGFAIEKGEMGCLLRDVSLSGEILRTLHQIVLIGKDLELHQGYCGKGGQTVPVSDGSPHLLLEDAFVGGKGAD
ncbi:MAG: TldD/PmbA family protein [Methanomicrobiales archaeon]|nr:TldD/PmbA family protein [Methanomicrobiales archaeon]